MGEKKKVVNKKVRTSSVFVDEAPDSPLTMAGKRLYNDALRRRKSLEQKIRIQKQALKDMSEESKLWMVSDLWVNPFVYFVYKIAKKMDQAEI